MEPHKQQAKIEGQGQQLVIDGVGLPDIRLGMAAW